MNKSLPNATTAYEQVLIDRFKAASQWIGVAVALTGGLVLLGWAFDIAMLKSVSPNWVAMKANTALTFILAGLALALQEKTAHRPVLLVVRTCAATTTLIGLLTLVEEFAGFSLGIDQLLFTEPANAAWTAHPGRMSLVTALNFSLIGVALLLLPQETSSHHRPSRWLMLPVLVASLLAVLGYLYGVRWLYDIPNFTPLALHTATMFVGLSVGILFVRPARGVTAVLVSAGPCGVMVRRLLPIALLLPIVGGWVCLQGELAGFYGVEFGVCLMVLMCLVPVSVMIWWTAVLLQRANIVRRQHEDRIQNIAANVPGVIFQFYADDTGKWRNHFVSEQSQDIFGISADPLDTYHERFTDHIAPEDRKRWLKSAERAIRTVTSWTFEGRFITPTGEEKYIKGLAQPTRLENEVVFNAIVLDNTARKRAEMAMLREQVFNSMLLENVADGVVACDANGTLVCFNRTSRQWHGMDAMALPPEEWADHYNLCGPDGRTPLTIEAIPLARAFHGEIIRDVGMTIVAKGQPPRWILASGGPFFDADGRILGAVVVMHDVTERKQAEEAIRESESKYRRLHQSMMDAFACVDMNGLIQECNDAYCQMLGYEREELLTLHYTDLTPEKWHSVEAEIIQKQVLPRRYSDIYEKEYRRKDGTVFPVELRTYLLTDDEDRPSGMWAIVRDITERKRTEQLQRMAQEATETAMRAKDEFLANMSHELRTPLNAIIGFSEGLLARVAIHPLNEHQQERVEGIRKGGEHLLALVQGVLDIAKVESGKADVNVTSFDIGEMAHEATNLAESLLEHKSAVQFTLDLEPDLPLITSDAEKIREILENFLSNAVKFTRQGTITLRIRRRSESLVMEVEDTGIGIPVAYVDKLFDKFFQVPGANVQSTKGTGLGLPVCKAYATLLGGKITVQSIEGHGSTFTLTLPFVCP